MLLSDASAGERPSLRPLLMEACRSGEAVKADPYGAGRSGPTWTASPSSGDGALRRPCGSLKGRSDGPHARRRTPTALLRKDCLAMSKSNLKTVSQSLGNNVTPDRQQGADELLQCLPKALKLVREGAGYRQTDASARSGLSKAMLSSYETGKTVPSLGSLTILLVAIGRDFADLQDAMDLLLGTSPKRQPTNKDLEREVGQVVLKAIEYVVERRERDATSSSARDGGEA